MTFALKVKKSGAKLSDCPFMARERLQEEEPGFVAPALHSYVQVSDELEKEAIGVDFREAAEAIGGRYGLEDGKEAISLRLINRVYELRKEGLFEKGEHSRDSWAKIIICDYVRRKGSRPLTGDWIALGHFPHTASHVKAFQSNAEKKIADAFKNDLDGLKQHSMELGGVETEGRVKADYVCCFDLLPHVPLYLSFWRADEEFDADCKLLFDSGAEDRIDIEYLANLLERFVEELVSAC
jgi:hypothetical protein